MVSELLEVVPGCLTDIDRVIPLPDTVIVPLLWAPVLFVVRIVKLPLPDPLDGDTVNHDVALLDAVHDALEVTVITWLAVADVAGDHVVGLMLSKGAPAIVRVLYHVVCTFVVLLAGPPVAEIQIFNGRPAELVGSGIATLLVVIPFLSNILKPGSFSVSTPL